VTVDPCDAIDLPVAFEIVHQVSERARVSHPLRTVAVVRAMALRARRA
jgi:hypothetical protein